LFRVNKEKEVTMAGIYANLAQLMASREMSVSRTPFNPDIVVVKRASFRKGEVPAHLRGFLIKSGECSGRTGTMVYKGRLVPQTAVCVAEKHGR
jgi:hypothetical protein